MSTTGDAEAAARLVSFGMRPKQRTAEYRVPETTSVPKEPHGVPGFAAEAPGH